MSFAVAADAYDRFMGRYSTLLAPRLADLAGVESGQTALDVGCGTGALTGELVRRLGSASVSAVDPSTSFVDAARERYPGVTIEQASAERLPFANQTFDAVLAQLVVHFMSDPVAGLVEMARVARSGGVIAACVWDYAGDTAPLSLFWDAARSLDPGVVDESHLAGAREGHLVDLFEEAGLQQVAGSSITVQLDHPTFDEWWEPYLLGVGPAGAYVTGLDPDRQALLRERCRAMLPAEPFVQTAKAWAARGVVGTRPSS